MVVGKRQKARLWLRIRRPLGCKQTRNIVRGKAISSFGGDRQGYWGDGVGYQCYAGIRRKPLDLSDMMISALGMPDVTIHSVWANGRPCPSFLSAGQNPVPYRHRARPA